MKSAHVFGPNPTGVSVTRNGESHVTHCVNSRNPAGHNPDCPCKTHPQKIRASQVIPYADHPHEECAADCPECVAQAWWHQEQTWKRKQ